MIASKRRDSSDSSNSERRLGRRWRLFDWRQPRAVERRLRSAWEARCPERRNIEIPSCSCEFQLDKMQAPQTSLTRGETAFYRFVGALAAAIDTSPHPADKQLKRVGEACNTAEKIDVRSHQENPPNDHGLHHPGIHEWEFPPRLILLRHAPCDACGKSPISLARDVFSSPAP